MIIDTEKKDPLESFFNLSKVKKHGKVGKAIVSMEHVDLDKSIPHETFLKKKQQHAIRSTQFKQEDDIIYTPFSHPQSRKEPKSKSSAAVASPKKNELCSNSDSPSKPLHEADKCPSTSLGDSPFVYISDS